MSDIMPSSSHPSSQPSAVASITVHFSKTQSKTLSLEFAGWVGQDSLAWTPNCFATTGHKGWDAWAGAGAPVP